MGVLDGRVACITGGTRGIGLAIAKAFLDEGAKVVINGRDAAKAQRSIDELKAGDRVHFIAGDVKKKEDCIKVVDGTVAHFGRIDIMVPNAGGGSDYAPVVDMTDESMQDAMTWNFWHTFWTMQASLKHMIPQQYGRILAMSSVEGKVGKPAISSYVASKHAIIRPLQIGLEGSGHARHHGERALSGRHRDRRHDGAGSRSRRGDGPHLRGAAEPVRSGVRGEAFERMRGRGPGGRPSRIGSRSRNHGIDDLDRRRHLAVLTQGD